MKLTKKYISGLIEKYFDGSITEQELACLDNLLKEDKDILALFNSYKNKFLLSKTHSLESANSWSVLRSKINNQQIQKKKNNRSLGNLIKIAAILTIFFGLAIVFTKNNVFTKTEETALVFESSTQSGQKSFLLLPDSSKVWLNSESTIKYNSNYNITNRDIELIGEAYFEVAHGKKFRFAVKTNDYTTVATGTAFNVMAYHDLGRTETTLVDGGVDIITNNESKTETSVCKLTPGQKIQYSHLNQKFLKTIVDTTFDIAWRRNEFVFNDISFIDLIKRLERWYNVKINIESDDLYYIHYSGKFKYQESIWQVLDIIQTTTPIDYKIINREVYIKPKNAYGIN